MKAWTLIATLAVAGPAYAIPPVLPPGAAEFVRAFIRANMDNDVAGYGELLSPDAKVVNGGDAAVGKAEWMKTISAEFVRNRQTRYLDVFAGGRAADGAGIFSIVLVEAVKVCFTYRAECFPTYHAETLTVRNGLVVELRRSEGLPRRLTPEGAYAPLE